MDDLLCTLAAEQLPKYFNYGTSGFRDHASVLNPVLRRVAVIGTLKTAVSGKAIGIMITASHNPECDNGVKIVDSDGGMVSEEWEAYCEQLINCKTADDMKHVVLKIREKYQLGSIFQEVNTRECFVLTGHDTRASCPRLLSCVTSTLDALKVKHLDLGPLTTPQLHYAVAVHNRNTSPSPIADLLTDYSSRFSAAFNAFNSLLDGGGDSQKPSEHIPTCTVDAANGIGGPRLKDLAAHLKFLNVSVVNDGDGVLNLECGADYVKTNCKPPRNVSLAMNECYASLDGDADRIIFYSLSTQGQFCLLDGDRLTVLFITLLQKLLGSAGLGDVNMIAVQTAYANGASTHYMTSVLGVPTVFACTGVKHLHKEAVNADIGVYFEANGHGTVIYSPEMSDRIDNLDPIVRDNRILQLFKQSTNWTIGDAMTDLLLAIEALRYLQWSLLDWFDVYTDLPNRLAKVSVADRNQIKVTNADREVVSPKGLQEELNNLMREHAGSRCFVRPSGTEDVVRIYAEAPETSQVESLIKGAESLVMKYCS